MLLVELGADSSFEFLGLSFKLVEFNCFFFLGRGFTLRLCSGRARINTDFCVGFSGAVLSNRWSAKFQTAYDASIDTAWKTCPVSGVARQREA